MRRCEREQVAYRITLRSMTFADGRARNRLANAIRCVERVFGLACIKTEVIKLPSLPVGDDIDPSTAPKAQEVCHESDRYAC